MPYKKTLPDFRQWLEENPNVMDPQNTIEKDEIRYGPNETYYVEIKAAYQNAGILKKPYYQIGVTVTFFNEKEKTFETISLKELPSNTQNKIIRDAQTLSKKTGIDVIVIS